MVIRLHIVLSVLVDVSNKFHRGEPLHDHLATVVFNGSKLFHGTNHSDMGGIFYL